MDDNLIRVERIEIALIGLDDEVLRLTTARPRMVFRHGDRLDLTVQYSFTATGPTEMPIQTRRGPS